MTPLPTAECYPISVAPGLSRLYLDYCSGDPAVRRFYGTVFGEPWHRGRRQAPAHFAQLTSIVAEQNPGAEKQLDALRRGAGTVLTGQQVSLFGGPLFTPFKAATALARARQASAEGDEHVGIFWLASEDHDFAEINHVTFPARRELRKLVYPADSSSVRPVGPIVLDESILPLIDQAWELLGSSDAMDALAESYKPGRTFAQAFADFYGKVFAAQGLLVLDASGRDFHRMGAPVLRAALERADEFHSALVERNRELKGAGYHAQVAVAPNRACCS